MSIYHAVKNACEKRIVRNWDTTYWAIDLHGTILPANYKPTNDLNIAPGAERVLRWLSNRKDHKLILWTSSYPINIEPVLAFFETRGIRFDYINRNPECQSNDLSNFTDKFFFDILVDDKAGFDPRIDWDQVWLAITNYFMKL